MKSHYNQRYFDERDLLIPHLAQTIKDIAGKHKLATILDIGCGTGRLIKYLSDEGFKASGCDISSVAVKAARQRNPRLKIVRASASKLPLPSRTFDLVCAISVIEHLTPKITDKFLKEARRVLKSHGFLFLVTPNFATPIRLIQKDRWFGYSDPTHIHFFTAKSIKSLLEKYSFGNFILTFPIKYSPALDWEFPRIPFRLPKIVKKIMIYLVFNSPLAAIRNSIWILAQKV